MLTDKYLILTKGGLPVILSSWTFYLSEFKKNTMTFIKSGKKMYIILVCSFGILAHFLVEIYRSNRNQNRIQILSLVSPYLIPVKGTGIYM